MVSQHRDMIQRALGLACDARSTLHQHHNVVVVVYDKEEDKFLEIVHFVPQIGRPNRPQKTSGHVCWVGLYHYF